MEYAKERNKDTSFVSVNTLIQPPKYDRSNETGKEVQKNEEPGLLARIISGGLTGAAWIIEKVPTFNFVPIPGFGFMQNFFKGMMVGSIERLSNEKVEHLWKIVQNVARAVTSFDYMKAYFWGFLKGFFGDFIMIWELPGTIKSTVIFIENLISKIKELSREDLREFAGRVDEIKSYIVEESSAYINNILQDIKAGKASELIIETLKSLTNFSQDAGKSVGGQLTGVMLNFFSKDHKELGKVLGGFMGELSGTVAFTALLAAITAGVGSVWGGVRAGIKTVAGIIGKGVGQAAKTIGTVFKNIGRIFGTFIDGVRAVIEGFGNGAAKLFKGIKGKLDEILVKVKGLIDDVVEKLGRDPNIVKPRLPKRISYAEYFDRELRNFNNGYKIKDVVREDMILVQFHSEALIGEGRSLKFWTTAQEANKFSTVEDYMNAMGLLSEWGSRNTVSVAKIPAGTQVKYAIGTAKEQISRITGEVRKGNGLQILFEEFDINWVVETRVIPQKKWR